MITVKDIYTTRNPQVRMLRLESTEEDTNSFNFFMVGLKSGNPTKRTVFFPVSVQFIEDKNIVVGCDFEACIGKVCKIVVKEGFEPTYIRSNGIPQEPKRIPGIEPAYYLTKDGNPIYRSTHLELDSSKFNDVLIKHDPIPDEIKQQIRVSNEVTNSKAYNDLVGGNILAEPELD